jgi:predicted PurR-regulated permease PerM
LGLPKKYVDQYISGQLVPELKRLFSQAPSFAVDMLSMLPGFLEKLINIILIPVSFFYFLLEWNLMTKSFIEFIPQKRRSHWIQVFRNIDKVLYGYIRGQSTVALIIGTLGGLSFWVLGIPYAGLLAVIIAFLDLIPFLGLILSLAIVEAVIMIALPMTFTNLITGPLVILGLHLLEVYAIGPRIVGKGVGIPAILIILSIFIFGYFFGFWGMLIAVPTTGVILLFVREYRQAVATHLE